MEVLIPTSPCSRTYRFWGLGPGHLFCGEGSILSIRDEPKQENSSRGEGQLPLGEAKSQWLQDTGLSGLLSGQGLDSEHQGLPYTLTPTQEVAVCCRLDIYVCSTGRQHKAPVRDVRDIFGFFSSMGVSSENGAWASQGPQPLLPNFQPLSLRDLQREAGREGAFRAWKVLGGLCPWGKEGRLVPAGCAEDPCSGPHGADCALCGLWLRLKRSKAGKWKATKTWVFRVPLDVLLEADRKVLPSTCCCPILEKRGLDTEGILRVPGYQARVKLGQGSPQDVSDVLKRFTRELPEALLTAVFLPAFPVMPSPDLKQYLQALHLLRGGLRAKQEDDSKEHFHGDAPKFPAPKLPKGKEKHLAEGVAEVVQMTVIPKHFLVANIRKWENCPPPPPVYCLAQFKVAKIRVAWPITDLLEVPLTPSTELARVPRRFTECFSPGSHRVKKAVRTQTPSPPRPVKAADILLWEVGRNISKPRMGNGSKPRSLGALDLEGEHHLASGAYPLDLYHANPCGEWVIQQSLT
ncbi:unnamed protein product [Nyctereutes procyonoides]|uniref:(raccoon dog) hypothetical protein n=1 Tax=Nyctereutes procyonoides TaxID=34880 RepID=A0A811XZM3_NYCPR|nr:unnamed protein product [Nyctereutes procyonoides]